MTQKNVIKQEIARLEKTIETLTKETVFKEEFKYEGMEVFYNNRLKVKEIQSLQKDLDFFKRELKQLETLNTF